MSERTREEISIETPYTFQIVKSKDVRDEIRETRGVVYQMSLEGPSVGAENTPSLATRQHEISGSRDIVDEEVDAFEDEDALSLIGAFFYPETFDDSAIESNRRVEASGNGFKRAVARRARMMAGHASLAGVVIGLGLMAAVNDALDSDVAFNHGMAGLMFATSGASIAMFYGVFADINEYKDVANAKRSHERTLRENAAATIAYLGARNMLEKQQQAEETPTV